MLLLNLPTRLIGSATIVTYRSEIARLAINIHSRDFIVLDFQRDTKIRRFPNPPTTEATISTMSTKTPTAGDSVTNSYRSNTLDPAAGVTTVSFMTISSGIYCPCNLVRSLIFQEFFFNNCLSEFSSTVL